jgi:hypothetical protein
VAAELKKELGLDSELVVGNSGEFTVWLDGKMVAEKKLGRFPEPAEVVAAIRST